jgi:hypothetical protein
MNRFTRITSVMVAVIVVAAAYASVSFATVTPELQTSAGASVAVGTSLKASLAPGTTFKFQSGGNEESCTKSTIEGLVTENGSGKIAVESTAISFSGPAPTGGCWTRIPDGLGGVLIATVKAVGQWCLSSTSAGSWSMTGCGGGPVSFLKELHNVNGTSYGSCQYNRATVTGTNPVNSSPLHLIFGGGNTFTKVPGGSGVCPGSQTVDASYDLKTASGGELKVS